MVFQKAKLGSSVKFFQRLRASRSLNFFSKLSRSAIFLQSLESLDLSPERLVYAFKILPSVCLGISRALREKRYSRFLTKPSNP